MSAYTVYRCDGCDADVSPDSFVNLHLGRQMDAAGSMDDESEDVHVCHRCALVLLRLATGSRGRHPIGRLDDTAVRQYLREFRKVVPK